LVKKLKVLSSGIKRLFWDYTHLSLEEKAIIAALALVADDIGTVMHYEALAKGFTLPATVNGAATLLGGKSRRKKMARLIQRLLEKGYLIKTPAPGGYNLQLTEQAFSAIGAFACPDESVIDISHARLAGRR